MKSISDMIRCGYEVSVSSNKGSRYIAAITSVNGSVTVIVENDDADLLLEDVLCIRIGALSALTAIYDKVTMLINDNGTHACYAYTFDEPPAHKIITSDTTAGLFDELESILDSEHIDLP